MFKSKRVDVSATDTLIGEGSAFEGKIASETSLRVEGRMIGDIECGGDVAIGESGKATSNIDARNVVIAGVVHGNVSARGTLTLTGTGRLYGDASADSLVVAEGAVFQGMCKMEGKAAAKEAEQSQEPTRAPQGEYSSSAV
ncbi:polymer-forming cytoskeletal protein [Paenibacillus sp.]|uniref:bactofilin family protein n=1 Tax=Paenibacillus sp. TaxID=58172 RepID=UPI00281220B5|nr:polymer-forming cytoskeletal protein [Paenibacillus sp.]